jgi:virulence-associated protein VapD
MMKIKEVAMAYPPKTDPATATWVIAFDIKLDRLYEYARDEQNQSILDGKTPDVYVRDLRAIIFNEIYKALSVYGFNKRLQNSLVFNNSADATIAFKAVSIGLARSWAKHFVERIHLFQIAPNSDAIELLNKEQVLGADDYPEWLDPQMLSFLTQADDDFI